MNEASRKQAGASAPKRERLVLGFEKDELEAKKGRTWCGLAPCGDGEGYDFWANFEYGREGSRAWTWRCRPGEVSEGRHALVAEIGPGAPPETFAPSAFFSHYYPALRENAEAWKIMTTFQWLPHAPAEFRDWSGFEQLRIDVRLDAHPGRIWLGLEDDVIEPPVVGVFELPAGRWVTLVLDLAEAARARGLDLRRVANFWLVGRAERQTEVRVDNVRLAAEGTPARFETPRACPPPACPAAASPARPRVPASAISAEADRSPVPLEKPVAIAAGSVVPFGWLAAHDNRHLILGYCEGKAGRNERKETPRVRASSDGGASWTPLPPPVARNLDHGTSRGSVIDVRGDVITVSSGPGCAGIGWATPRQHATKYTFTGSGWEMRRPAAILDCDIRHCGSAASIIRLDGGAHAGRLWAAWGTLDRRRALEVHARYSDDDGRTWRHDGPGALIPGSRQTPFSYNSYAYQQPRLARLGDHVACLWQDTHGLRWSRFEAGAWGAAEPIDAEARITLAVSENESFRVPGAALALDGRELFVTAHTIPGVLRYDGARWRQELPEADEGGALARCGEQVFLITSGNVPRPPKEKRMQVVREAPLLCYRRFPSGRWSAPLDISGGPVKLLEYRQMPGLVAPPYAPPHFVPVAWSNGETVWMVKVPALETGAG